MQNILFRADSSSKIGLGHIMRDLVLALQFKNSNITFASQNLVGNINDKILHEGYQVVLLKSTGKKELVQLIKKLKIDLLVIDNYEIDYKIEKYIKKKTDVKLFVFDDTYEKHHCDILLNHNLGADAKKYKKLVPKTCKLRCGSKYTLLRDEFYKEKKKKSTLKNKKIKTIFIAMGGTDHSNINPKILEVLSNFKNIKVNLVTSSSNNNLDELQRISKEKKWLKLHINSTKIAKLMRKSDLAIVTPSVILNEIYFMEIPFIAIKTASNQKHIANYLKTKRYNILKKLNNKLLTILLRKSLNMKNKNL